MLLRPVDGVEQPLALYPHDYRLLAPPSDSPEGANAGYQRIVGTRAGPGTMKDVKEASWPAS